MRLLRARFIVRGMIALVAVSVVSAGCSSSGPAEEPVPTAEDLGLKRPTAELVRGEGWAIAAPQDWSEFAAIRPPMTLYLIGDRRTGIPPTDGTLAAIQAGLTVEVHEPEAGLSPRGRAEQDLKALANSAGMEVQGQPTIREMKLADGTEAVGIRVEILRRPRRRLSRYEKVYCATADGRHVVATGFLTCGPGGGRFLEATGLAGFVAAHVGSLSLDAGRVDLADLGPAYGALDLLAVPALSEVEAADRHLAPGGYDRAAKGFRRSLRLCGEVSAAHNGLAWALLHGEGAGVAEQNEAVRHAGEAVEQTGRRDPAALDTLALAYRRSGEGGKALATIREALALSPDDAELAAKLEEYGKE
jgi:hypothetical protein